MVMKVLFIALVATAFACQCTDDAALKAQLEDFNPAEALDFFNGFVNGAQDQHCNIYQCQYTLSYFTTQIQAAITALESIIGGNFNPEMILPLICNFNTIYQGYEQLYSLCGVAGFLNSFDLFKSTAGLEMIGKNFGLHIGYFVDAYGTYRDCTADFKTCGYTWGIFYSRLTGWKITNSTALEAPYEAMDIPVFLDGLVEGLDNLELTNAKDTARQVLADLAKLSSGDLDMFQEIVKDYEFASEAFKSVSMPELNVENLAIKAVMNYGKISEKISAYESSGTHGKGAIVGELIALILN